MGKSKVVKSEIVNPTKVEMVNKINEINFSGTAVEFRKELGKQLGFGETKVRRLLSEYGITPTKDEETNLWSVKVKLQSQKLDSTSMMAEALQIVTEVNGGKTFKELSISMKRHVGEIGRKFHFGTLCEKYANIRKAVEMGKISPSIIYEVQRSSKELKEQYNIVASLVKGMEGDKVKRSDYLNLKGDDKLVTVAAVEQLKVIGHVS